MTFRKKITILFITVIALLLPIAISPTTAYASTYVYLGGMPAGFMISTRGAMVVGVCDVIGKDEILSPSKSAGIKAGDKILYVNNLETNSARDIEHSLDKYKKGSVLVIIERKGEELKLNVTPHKDLATSKYKLGLLIQDNMSGIGTITYITEDKQFGALGHAITEDNKKIDVVSGKVFECNIIDFIKGERGKAGELKGYFIKNKDFGSISFANEKGIFGKLNYVPEYSLDKKLEVASNSEIKPGKAYIYSTIQGETPLKYEISIIKVDENQRENKNLVIKITDEKLLEQTNGILQGMSGSPIVQNGKLVGAVTHVFLNDPTRGYGIAIENMMNN